jgi:osmotically-inducible protein OsmY
MRSGSDIRRDVEFELRWDPDIGATDVGVAVRSGVVTVTGSVRSFGQKLDAEAAAKRVAGVVGGANDLGCACP